MNKNQARAKQKAVRPARPRKKSHARGKYDRSLNSEQRRDEQRALLLDAAIEVFARKGWAGATVEAVIAKAGMSRRTFYDHFKDLKDLLAQVHDRAATLAFGLVSMHIAQHSDPLERIRAGVAAFLGAVAARGDVARVVFREVRSAGPEYEPRRELETTRYASLLLEAAAQAHAQGRLSRLPDELTAYALATAVEGVAMRYLTRGTEARALEAAPLLYELVLRAFR